MGKVEFTNQAERNLLEILGKENKLEETLLVVEMHDREAHLSVKSAADLVKLQRDIDVIGPFRVPLGGEEVSLFVRDSNLATGGLYELDYNSCGGHPCFQIRPVKGD